MKIFTPLILLLGPGLLLSGCANIRPAEMAITTRDEVSFGSPVPAAMVADQQERAALEFASVGRPKAINATRAAAENRQTERRYKVAILSPKGSTESAITMNRYLESAMSSLAGDLAYFSVVPRTEVTLVGVNEALETGGAAMDSGYPEAEYILMAETVSATVERSPARHIEGQGNVQDTRAHVSVSYKLYEKATETIVISKIIDARSGSVTQAAGSSTADPQMLQRAVDRTVEDFGLLLADRYAPPAKVVMTRGNGKVALIDLGENYGISNGSTLEFYYIDPDIADKDAQRVGIGYGEVIQADATTAWAKIHNSSNSTVMKGHLARVVRNQAKTSFFSTLMSE